MSNTPTKHWRFGETPHDQMNTANVASTLLCTEDGGASGTEESSCNKILMGGVLM